MRYNIVLAISQKLTRNKQEKSSDKDKRIHIDSLIIEELGYVSAPEGKYVTFKLDRWHFYMDRAKPSIQLLTTPTGPLRPFGWLD